MNGRLMRGGRMLAVASLMAFAPLSGGAQAQSTLPATEAELVAAVERAFLDRDDAAFDALVNWEGAGTIKKRIVRYQIRREFGRPIRHIGLEAMPAGALDAIGKRGTLRLNMPVTHRLRVEFEGPPRPEGNPPADVFLVGMRDGVYRIALVVRDEKAKDDD